MTELEFQVHLGIYDLAISPEQVSELLGLSPHWTGKEGNPFTLPNGKSIPGQLFRTSFWHYREEPPLEAPLDLQLDRLLKRLESIREKLGAISQIGQTKIEIVVRDTNSINPQFGVSGQQIQRIAALGLALDFDVYCSAAHAVQDN